MDARTRMAALTAIVLSWGLSGCALPCGKSASPNGASLCVSGRETSCVVFPERADQGYTLVLSGAWGEARPSHGIVQGLQDANVPSLVEFYDWTRTPGKVASNIRDTEHNGQQAAVIAEKLARYRQTHPGRPVTLIGYSAGGGIAVMALEKLPVEQSVTRAVLLAPTLSPEFDLKPALQRTEQGIVNFYSPLDVMVLMLAGTAVGTIDGHHTVAAGAVGFAASNNATADGTAIERNPGIIQKRYTPAMLMQGHLGGHYGWTNRVFVAKRIAPLLSTETMEPLPDSPATDPPQVAAKDRSSSTTADSPMVLPAANVTSQQ